MCVVTEADEGCMGKSQDELWIRLKNMYWSYLKGEETMGVLQQEENAVVAAGLTIADCEEIYRQAKQAFNR